MPLLVLLFCLDFLQTSRNLLILDIYGSILQESIFGLMFLPSVEHRFKIKFSDFVFFKENDKSLIFSINSLRFDIVFTKRLTNFL